MWLRLAAMLRADEKGCCANGERGPQPPEAFWKELQGCPQRRVTAQAWLLHWLLALALVTLVWSSTSALATLVPSALVTTALLPPHVPLQEPCQKAEVLAQTPVASAAQALAVEPETIGADRCLGSKWHCWQSLAPDWEGHCRSQWGSEAFQRG